MEARTGFNRWENSSEGVCCQSAERWVYPGRSGSSARVKPGSESATGVHGLFGLSIVVLFVEGPCCQWWAR
jgi:hypothetical protein